MDITKTTLNEKEAKARDVAIYGVPDADPNFVKRHNDEVIDESIKKHEANLRSRNRAYMNQVGERSDAVVSYLKHLNRSNGNMPVEEYFSARELAHLRGQKRIQKIRTLMNGQKVIEFEEL